jgi:hypothetical protein
VTDIRVVQENGRVRIHHPNGTEIFIIESIGQGKGLLLTVFKYRYGVIEQKLIEGGSMDAEIERINSAAALGKAPIVYEDGPAEVDTGVLCSRCRKGAVVRELDLVAPKTMKDIPVVPVFACRSCGSRFYSITKEYLSQLAKENTALFEVNELAEKDVDEGAFINELQEYIIRIFASKRIYPFGKGAEDGN